MDIKKELKEYKEDVDVILENFLNKKVAENEKFSPFVKSFLETLSEFTLRGGKRIRPALMYYTYSMLSDKELEEIKKASIYIELIQSFLLIHDDIMDRSPLRRGDKTVHKIFEEYSKIQKYKDDYHFGNTMGILNGDMACLLAYEIVSSSNLEKSKQSDLTNLISTKVSEVILGQIHDVLLAYESNYTKEDILKIHTYKTATYTFELPISSGVILARGGEDEHKILMEYSKFCGIAFQIQDDILGVFGKDDITGKGAKSDIKENKKTLLTLQAYENSNKKQKDILNKLLGKEKLSDKEADLVRQIIIDTGSFDYSVKELKKYVQKAQKELNKLEYKNEGKDFLYAITDYLAEREY